MPGGEAVPLAHLLRRVADRIGKAPPGGEDGRRFVHQLERVAIAGDDDHLQPDLLRLPRQRADDVVGLVVLQLDNGDAQDVQKLADARHLRAHLIGHVRTMGLVSLVIPEAERRSLVEGHDDVVGLLFLQDGEEHRGKAVHRIGQLPARGLQVGRERVISAVCKGVAVHQHQLFLLHRYASATVGTRGL